MAVDISPESYGRDEGETRIGIETTMPVGTHIPRLAVATREKPASGLKQQVKDAIDEFGRVATREKPASGLKPSDRDSPIHEDIVC